MGKKVERYSDIIDLPHHQSVRRPHIPNYNRAAQFAPFAALVGYDQMVQDTADILLLDKRIILSEDQKNILDEKLNRLKNLSLENIEIFVLYFEEIACGIGRYISYYGKVKKLEKHPARLIMMDKKQIYINDILEIDV